MNFPKTILTDAVMMFAFVGVASAQECGPICPVCSGAGNNSGALLSPGSLMISGLSIPTSEEETTVMNVRIGALNWLDAGLGYTFRIEEVLWSARIQPMAERVNSWQPGLVLGTGSVRAGGVDQAVYGQIIKSWKINQSYDVSLSIGAATLMPDRDELFGLTGIKAGYNQKYTLFANYDGKSFHQGLSWMPSDQLTVSFLMVESEFPALSVSIRR